MYGKWIKEACDKYDLDPSILAGLIKQESNFYHKAKSYAGAYGLTQVMPATAKCYGYDLSTPKSQIFAGADYLRKCYNHRAVNGDTILALADYNAGWGNVSKYGGVPPFKQTREYVVLVPKHAKQYRKFLAENYGEKPAEKIKEVKRAKRVAWWFVNRLKRKQKEVVWNG
jgi:soluble lytic murein transglycosylase-like protein